jgi:hypothetical protein
LPSGGEPLLGLPAKPYDCIMRLSPLAFAATLLVIEVLTLSGALRAQSIQIAPPRTPETEIACRAYPRTAQSYKRKLWDGYEISLGPAANASGGGGDDCTAAIYNSAGHVVYRTTGFNVTFDQNLTGLDFDGDGHPEVVFQTDTCGGNHCCWEYNVISLFPRPHKLFDISEEGLDQFEKDASGKMIIWKRVEAPDEFNGPMASRPFVERVYRVRNGKMVDATPEFCDRIFSSQNRDFKIWSTNLTSENLAGLKSSGGPRPDEEQTARLLLERAYQHVLCRQFDEALADLNLWPTASRAKMKADFAAYIKDDFPEFAAHLAEELPQTTESK